MRTALGRDAWSQLGGDLDALALVAAPDPPIALSCALDVPALLGDCVGLATLAANEIQVARALLPASTPVHVDGRRVTTASRSERHFTLDGRSPEVWAPLSGFWQAADGWVRTHGNYPHHAACLARILGVSENSSTDEIAAAIARRPAVELEDQAAEVGAIVGAVRAPEAWGQHPHAREIGSLPVIEWQTGGGAAPRRWTSGAERPLAGVRVLDLTRVLAGPVATRNLALLGADVLRIDPPRLPETGWIHLDTGAGKRSATLDLRAPGERRIFEDLLDEADVVVTGYRPGALDALGLSPQALADRRPGLVVGSVSAWGTSGPWARRRGFDSVVQAVIGIAMTLSDVGARPGALPAQALDHAAGYLLTAGLCRGLLQQRERGGTPRVAVALATIARELLTTEATPTDTPLEPTLQTGRTPAGVITCAAPPLVGPCIPRSYPTLASPWGADAPRWNAQGGR